MDGSIHTGGVGTRLYMAPEIREGKVYSSPVDIYALGIILLELFCTFQTGSERIQIILQVTQAQSLPEELTLYKGYWFLNLFLTERADKGKFVSKF